MSNISAQIKLRPVRFGFLVSPQDTKSVLEIIRINTCLWGGKFNPIIPRFNAMPKWWNRDGYKFESPGQIINGYLDYFEPDFLVESSEGLAEGLGYSKEKIFGLSTILANAKDFDRGGHGLNALDIYRYLYNKEYQFSRRHEHDIIDVMPEEKQFKNFSAALFGAFPTEPNFEYIQNAFFDAFAPRQITLNGNELLKLYKSGFTSALRVGHSSVEIDYHDDGDPTLFVMNAFELPDIIDYWNLRAVTRHVLPIPIQWLEQLSDFCKDFIISNYRPLPHNNNGVMMHATTMFSRTLSDPEIEDLYNKFFRVDIDGANVKQTWYPSLWRSSPSFTTRRMRASLSAAEEIINIPLNSEDSSLQFKSLSPDFAAQYGNEHRWANIIRLREWGSKGKFATVFPSEYRDPVTAIFGLFADQASTSTEGFLVFPQFKKSAEYCKLIDGNSAITKWLSAKGVQSAPSDAGRITRQIIQTLGGFWGVSRLANAEIVKYLNSISRKPNSKSTQNQEFKNRIQGSIAKEDWPRNNFDVLVDKNVVELGLEVRCTKCSSWSWYSLPQLNYKIICSLCLQEFPFPIVEPNSRKRTRWSYRLVGPFALPNYANGGYSAALSIRFFAEVVGRFDHAGVTWSSGQELQLEPGVKVESDFILWYQRKAMIGHDYPTDLVFGEAKSFRGTFLEQGKERQDAFEADDIDRMKKLATKFPGSILVFSTMKEAGDLSKAEILRIAKLALWGREYIKDKRKTRAPVIILTGTELFAPRFLADTWNKIGGQHAILVEHGLVRTENLRVLADLTQQLYLDLPSYGVWLEEKYRKIRTRRLSK